MGTKTLRSGSVCYKINTNKIKINQGNLGEILNKIMLESNNTVAAFLVITRER